ncbi:hypothetical protein MUN89_00740 [Halobacillus salinarum]|uniref:Uncharacterized protein n=1 Tax=Halobacillus salinarum TaxID=2932257 RepID=A0ABY4EJA3_9BACI|nr:hypothetical protein [Halobacillus salinarum]UOQ44556.1 hypothetical protein MUN89_00740 [Halobacillus salinarum]
MKKRKTVKWFTGITAAVTAASFIGFVQNHNVVGQSTPESGFEQQKSQDSIPFGDGDDGDEFNNGDPNGMFEQEEDRGFQGMEPSDRRTGHS